MKKRNFVIIILILIAVVITVLITNILLDTTGSINQGKFRVNDVVIKSTVNVEELTTESEELSGFESIKLNLSQSNSLVMLVTKDEEFENAYIDNISLKNPEIMGNIIISEGESATNIIDMSQKQVSIYPVEKDGQYLIQINIDNVNFITDANIPSGVNSVTYDGTMLRVLDIAIAKLKFELRFNINLVDKSGKINTCKIKLNLPDEQLLENGISVNREDLSNYKFSVKNKSLF